MGIVVLQVKVSGSNCLSIEIVLERENFITATLEDCVRLTKILSPALYESNIVEQDYMLEVVSSGVDRALISVEDFKRFVGSFVVIKTKTAIKAQKKFKGVLVKVVEDKEVVIRLKDGEEVGIDLNLVHKANLGM